MKNTKTKTNKFHFRTLALMFLIALVAVCVPATTHTEAKTAAVMKLSATSKTMDIGKTYTIKIYTRGNSVIDNKGRVAKLADKDDVHYWFDYKTKATWKSSNPKVATVSSTGKVTAKKKGTTTITAKTNGKTYKCKVTVLRPISKSLLKFEEIPTAGNGGLSGAGLAYKITNNNDYTVEFSLWGDFYAMNPDKEYKYEWTSKEDYYMGRFVIAPKESIYVTKATPCDTFYEYDNGQISKYPTDYYPDGSISYIAPVFMETDGIDIRTTDYDIITARTYTKFKTRIEDFKKTSLKSEVSNIKITLSADGKTLSVTNKGKVAVTDLWLECWRLNDKGEIDSVIAVLTYNLGTKTIKPGKTYSMKVGGKNTNWEEIFGKNGVPDRIVISNADTVEISY